MKVYLYPAWVQSSAQPAAGKFANGRRSEMRQVQEDDVRKYVQNSVVGKVATMWELRTHSNKQSERVFLHHYIICMFLFCCDISCQCLVNLFTRLASPATDVDVSGFHRLRPNELSDGRLSRELSPALRTRGVRGRVSRQKGSSGGRLGHPVQWKVNGKRYI